MKKLTIKVRIMLWYTVLLVMLLGIFFPYMYFTMSQSMYNDAEILLKTDANLAVEALEVEGNNMKLDEDVDLETTYIAVYSKDNKILFGKLPKGLNAIAKPTLNKVMKQGDTVNKWIVLDVPLIQNGKNIGWLRAVKSLDIIDKTLHNLKFVILIFVPIYLIIAVFGGLFIAKRALSPIDYITKTAKQIGHGDLSKRILLGESRDEVGRLAETFDEMLNHLEESFIREKQFASDASHELRTPTAVIMAHAEEALSGEKKQSEYKESMETIYNESKKMSLMISQLLMLSRNYEGNYAHEMEKVDLSLVVSSVVDEMLLITQGTDIKIYTQIEDNVIIMADQTLLTRLLINLIDNALKYNVPNGWVKVTLHNEKKSAYLTVEDSGIGISKEDLPKIWNRLYRVDKSHSGVGCGLGLSIVKWIVEIHGGSITAKSELNKGSVFEVRFEK